MVMRIRGLSATARVANNEGMWFRCAAALSLSAAACGFHPEGGEQPTGDGPGIDDAGNRTVTLRDDSEADALVVIQPQPV